MKITAPIAIICTTLIVGGAATIAGQVLLTHYREKFYPGTVIDGISLADLTLPQAISKIDEAKLPDFTVRLHVDDIEVASSASQLAIRRNSAEMAQLAFDNSHRGPIGKQLIWALHIPVNPQEFSTKIVLDQTKAAEMVAALKAKVDVDGEAPRATLGTTENAATLKVSPGKVGRTVLADQTLAKFAEIADAGNTELTADVASTSAALTPDELASASARAKGLVKKKILLRADAAFQELNDQALIKLLAFPSGLNEAAVADLTNQLTKQINRPPQDAVFEYDTATLQVKKFVPARKGLEVTSSQLNRLLTDALGDLEKTTTTTKDLAIPVTESEPKTSLADTNDIGIKERIGFGDSQYQHSIPNRIHNVALTASRVEDVLVKPGEEFSFNKALGDVSAATGFKSAYVIRNGKTELGDGGGVCQVSTTLFRAVLNAGLPVTKRRPHSYRVSYYELNSKPGIDATVYAGDVDLRFINDTGHYILLHNATDSEKLYMYVEIYGTSDGRSAEIVDHKTYDFLPAPPPLYVDDPTLKQGVLKQIDFAASGIKASFKNIVKDKAGKIIREDTYFSNYKPWQAVFLRGTGG